MAIQSDLSPAKRKLRTFSKSRLVPVARSRMASLGAAGAAGAAAAPAAPAAPPPPRPPRPPPRPPRPVAPLGYSRNAGLVTPPAAPRPPPAATPPGSPIGKLISFAPALVARTTTSASPSLGPRAYANHLPSFERVGVRIDFHVRRSSSVSWRPADAGGVHFDTGAALVAPNGRLAFSFNPALAAACYAPAGIASVMRAVTAKKESTRRIWFSFDGGTALQ